MNREHARLNTRVIGAMLVAAMIGLATAFAIRSVRATPSQTSATVAGAGVSDLVLPLVEQRAFSQTGTGSVDPNAIVWSEDFDTSPLSITTTVTLSDNVIEGTVVEIVPAQFNTPTGAPPPGSDPVPDDFDSELAWTLHRLVVLQVTTRYSGDVTNTHAVIAARGGQYDADSDGLADYVHEVHGFDFGDVAVGDKYFIYGLYPFTVPPAMANGEEWEEAGLAKAAALTSGGTPAIFLEYYAAFKIISTTASSDKYNQSFLLDWLRQVTLDLTS